MSNKEALFQSTKHTEYCPQCHLELQIKRGKQGLFLACSGYPNCDYLKPLQQTNHIIKDLAESCPECGAFLQIKQGAFGIFIGCSRYPECHFIVQEAVSAEAEFTCPDCKQHKLIARRGRSGKIFYGCGGYPDCRFTLPSQPIEKTCPQCGGHMAIMKKLRDKKGYLCANKHCRHLFSD